MVASAVMATSATAQVALMGAWEVCVEPSTAAVEDVQHRFMRFGELGDYQQVVLSDNPDHPISEVTGSYEVLGGEVRLTRLVEGGEILLPETRIPFQLAQDGSLLWEQPPLVFRRAGQIPDAAYGRWAILAPPDGPVVGEVVLDPGGTFELELGGSRDRGYFRIAGSGLLSVTTESNRVDGVGVPAVWTNVQVRDNRLSYDIFCGFTVTAVRLGLTTVPSVPWGQVKIDVRDGVWPP